MPESSDGGGKSRAEEKGRRRQRRFASVRNQRASDNV